MCRALNGTKDLTTEWPRRGGPKKVFSSMSAFVYVMRKNLDRTLPSGMINQVG
jgi:hypothetical protein